MSRRHSHWLFVVVATIASTSSGFAQDPIPIGYSGYPQQGYYPQGYGPPPYPPQGYAPQPNPYAQNPYAAMPYGYPPQQMQQQPAQQGVITAALRSSTHRHSAPAMPPACVEGAPVAGSPCKSCHCSGLLCAFSNGPTVPLFDGSHLKSCFAGYLGHPTFARRPGPTAIDSLPTHPYARSPRDFFMFYENLEAERSRDMRPALIP